MNRLSELKENRKLDNKGFSLVELIIVIAIMAVLIGVLAPQYLKYVDRSRESADADQIDKLISAVEIYSAANGVVSGDISIDGDGTVTPSTSVETALADAGIKVDTNKPLMTSKTFKQVCTINFDTDGVTINVEEIANVLGREYKP